MNNLLFPFNYNGSEHSIELVFVPGMPNGTPFLFGQQGEEQAIQIPDFYIAKFPTTQALWKYIMGEGSDRSQFKGDENPVENVSWDDVSRVGGFLEKLNQEFQAKGTFRLPTETEWEYAARGGRQWTDNFIYGGSNDPDGVAWYKNNSDDKTWPVGQKAPNQLGLYDMNGNIWEWCQDWFVNDVAAIPEDGTAYSIPARDKVLRGGCYLNWPMHCTNTKRYEIMPHFFDGCIGFRMALSLDQ